MLNYTTKKLKISEQHKSGQMLGTGEADKNKPENTEVLMQMEKQFVRAFRTISELKGTSRRSKKKSSPHCMIFKGPKLGGLTSLVPDQEQYRSSVSKQN